MSRRYKGYVARIIVQYFDWSNSFDYETFIDEVENFMNYKRDTLKKMAFQIYDFDSDHQICSLDLYTFLKNYEHDEECFFKAFSNDINKIESELDHRRVK